MKTMGNPGEIVELNMISELRIHMKVMASGPITSWEIDGETVKTVSDFTFWGAKITADGDCSHEIKRHESYDQYS